MEECTDRRNLLRQQLQMYRKGQGLDNVRLLASMPLYQATSAQFVLMLQTHSSVCGALHGRAAR